MIKEICADALTIVEPAKDGYQLTIKLNLSKIPPGKESIKVITEISAVQAKLLSCQLKEMLRNVNSQEQLQGMYKPIKLVYHHREPFFVIRQPRKIATVFPMRFKEDPDVIVATTFFQVQLMDVGSSEEWAKAPPCTWSPIPPAELRGEPLEDLSTNCGFVSFDITSHHVKGKRLDKIVWSLLNFHAFVKYHVKCTRGFTQRRMRKRLNSLVKVINQYHTFKYNYLVSDCYPDVLCSFFKLQILHSEGPEEEREHEEEPKGCGCMSSFASTSRAKNLKRRCQNLFVRKSKRIHFPVKVRGGMRFRHRWLKIPKFSSPRRYTKLD
ncbi:actin-related protein 2/3 complex subunit 2B-like [Punica granatum]|uniref:Arp2/3 complex 34 kDa subunit n=1 Tax=Punica granatum TaxID=22663 RepID=A0A6P8D9P6_PUNGR|nr:actin-related protein 2/3 complex subunit 2B-like [Punica granatum]